jgi:hypothetical protein
MESNCQVSLYSVCRDDLKKPYHYAHVHNQSVRLGCSLVESRRAESGRAVPKNLSTI